MIEVLFGESEAASMKIAKNTIMIGRTDGPISVFLAGKQKGNRIEGTSDEVICLGLMLDVGNIKEVPDSDDRRKLICSMYSQEQWGRDEDTDDELQAAADLYTRELQRLKNFLNDGEEIRVWYSDAPYSLCGFYFLCDIFRNYENKIHAVKLPKYKIRSNEITFYQHWGEVSDEEFADFLIEEKELTKEEIKVYSVLWKELREDNSPLRAVVNGRLLGVPEDFYDCLIWKNLTKNPVKEARFIGDLLGKNRIGISDLWYAKRIDFHIAQGNIAVTGDSERKYERMICLA